MRLLTADEIEVRVGQTFNTQWKKCERGEKPAHETLLLYKTARADMAILDELYGPMNWKRKHEIKDGVNYCTISVWDESKGMWVEKEDCGTESQMEAEKGGSSDAFKRAGTNWGIGRELYTGPKIFVDSSESYFDVDEIGYDDIGRINRLVISCKGNVVYEYGTKAKKKQEGKATPKKESKPSTDASVDMAELKSVWTFMLETFGFAKSVGGQTLTPQEEAHNKKALALAKRYLYKNYGVDEPKKLNANQVAEIVDAFSKPLGPEWFADEDIA